MASKFAARARSGIQFIKMLFLLLHNSICEYKLSFKNRFVLEILIIYFIRAKK